MCFISAPINTPLVLLMAAAHEAKMRRPESREISRHHMDVVVGVGVGAKAGFLPSDIQKLLVVGTAAVQ